MPKRAPQIITVRALNNSVINVTWDALSKQDFQGAAQGYKILYKEMNSTAKYEVLTEYGAIYTTVIGNLKSGTWYTIRVLAFNVYGDGPPGAVANVETQGETIIIREMVGCAVLYLDQYPVWLYKPGHFVVMD